jgi:uncharacterized protein YyaL (SSP411 family)
VLLKLGALTGQGRYEDAAQTAIGQVTSYAHRYPTAFAQWLSAMAFSLSEPIEIAIVGDHASADAEPLLDVVRSAYRPFAVIAAGRSAQTNVPLLADRPMLEGRQTAYVCRAFACRAPTANPEELASQIASRT